MDEVRFAPGREAAERASRPRRRAGVERRHGEGGGERQAERGRDDADGVDQRDRRAGERAVFVDQLPADAGHPATLQFEGIRAAGRRRHGVGDERDPERALGRDRRAAGEAMNVLAVRDQAADDARVGEDGADDAGLRGNAVGSSR